MTSQQCMECGSVFDNITKLNIHYRKCSDKRSFECKKCDKKFIGMVKFNNHQQTQLGTPIHMSRSLRSMTQFNSTHVGSSVPTRLRRKATPSPRSSSPSSSPSSPSTRIFSKAFQTKLSLWHTDLNNLGQGPFSGRLNQDIQILILSTFRP